MIRWLLPACACAGFAEAAAAGGEVQGHYRRSPVRREVTGTVALAVESDGSLVPSSGSWVLPQRSAAGRDASMALVVVEAQESFRNQYSPATVQTICRLAAFFEDQGWPVFRRSWCAADTEVASGEGGRPDRILTELAPRTLEALQRTWISSHYNVFDDVMLDKWLRHEGVVTLVLVGGFAELSLMATTYRALDLGYEVIVPDDDVGAAAPDPALSIEAGIRRLALQALRQAGASVMSSREALLAALRNPGGADPIDAQCNPRPVPVELLGAVHQPSFMSEGASPYELDSRDIQNASSKREKTTWQRFDERQYFNKRKRRLALLVLACPRMPADSEALMPAPWRVNLATLEGSLVAGGRPVLRQKEVRGRSAFLGDAGLELLDILSKSADTVIIAGGEAQPGTLAATAFAAFAQGLDVVVAADAVEVAPGSNLTSTLTLLERSVGMCLSTWEVLNPLSSALALGVNGDTAELSYLSYRSITEWLGPRRTELLAPFLARLMEIFYCAVPFLVFVAGLVGVGVTMEWSGAFSNRIDFEGKSLLWARFDRLRRGAFAWTPRSDDDDGTI